MIVHVHATQWRSLSLLKLRNVKDSVKGGFGDPPPIASKSILRYSAQFQRAF